MGPPQLNSAMTVCTAMLVTFLGAPDKGYRFSVGLGSVNRRQMLGIEHGHMLERFRCDPSRPICSRR